MKQIFQSLRSGETSVEAVPRPNVKAGHVLVKTTTSLISVGTERMLVDFGRAGFIDKAMKQPDKVAMVLEKIKTDGISAALESVFNKLNEPIPMGYSNVGVVVDVGKGVADFSVGDSVVSNGFHAEFVSVPQNLCAKIPSSVSAETAAYTVLGAIGLQGIRLLKVELGETIVVMGMGLIGLLSVQILRAAGCRVIALDVVSERLALAEQYGAIAFEANAGSDVVQTVMSSTNGVGADGVLVTASTSSSEPISNAAKMCRKRGRVVLTGVTGLELSRDDFYEKEISFQVSCSYGPGRYDPTYEDMGIDYPIGYVRWTEKRNFESVLSLMESGSIRVNDLTTNIYPLEKAEDAYEEIISNASSSLGLLLAYSEEADGSQIIENSSLYETKAGTGKATVSFIGAGGYANKTLIPAFKKAGANFDTVVSNSGVGAGRAMRQFSFKRASTDARDALSGPSANIIVIATRHDSHAKLAVESLAAGKHVFVEKPLCLNWSEFKKLKSVAEIYASNLILTVGFNRRFAPLIIKTKQLVDNVLAPKVFCMTVNAGYLPADHWTQDREIGGGRLIGEACHFVDLLRFLSGSEIDRCDKTTMKDETGDTFSIQMHFKNGSMGLIHYFSNGHRAVSKERLEIYSQGGVLRMDNYRSLKGWGWPGFNKMSKLSQDKGQRHCAKAFIEAVERNLDPPIPINELFEVAEVCLKLAEL